MIIIFGPSASGKTEVGNMLQFKYGVKKAITCTTRPPRLGEEDNIDYYFLTKDEILKEKEEGKLAEMTLYNDNYYGVRIGELADDKCLIVDPSGVKSFLKLNDPKIVIFYLFARPVTRFNRMLIRRDNVEKAHQRINNDSELFNDKNLPYYDYLIDTDQISIEDATDLVYHRYHERLSELEAKNNKK